MDISTINNRPTETSRYLSNYEHTEYIPKHYVYYLLMKARELGINRECETLLRKLSTKISNDDIVKVKCHLPHKIRYGRLVPQPHSLTYLRRDIRNTLVGHLYYDLDMVNAQPSILVSILRNCVGVPFYNTWKSYVENREVILNGLNTDYPNVLAEDETWKTKIVKVLYGSSDTHNIPFLINLQTEIKAIYDYLKKRQTNTFRKSIYNKEVEENPCGKFMAVYLQNFEMDIVDDVVRRFITCEDYMSYEFDGCKVWKEMVDMGDGGLDGLLQRINEHVQHKYHYVSFISKPMTERFEVNEDELEQVKALMIDVCDEQGLVDLIDRAYGQNIVFQGEKSWVFTGTKWEYDDKLSYYLIDNMYRIAMEYIDGLIDRDNPLYATLKHEIEKLRVCSKNTAVYRFCKAKFQKKHIKFDRSSHLLGFDNMVYDLMKGEVRDKRFSDFITMSVGCDYVAKENIQVPTIDGVDEEGNDIIRMVGFEEKKEEMMGIFRKIFHNELENLEFYIFMLCSCLLGKKQDKIFFLTASGRNGKSMLDELWHYALGDYAAKVLPAIITKEMVGGANPEMANVHLKRFVYMEEPNQDTKMRNANIKSLTGSDGINARKCHDNEVNRTNHATFVMEVNKIPSLQETPQVADIERIVILPFNSFFGAENTEDDYEKRSFIQNKLYVDEDWRKGMQMTLLHIVLDKYPEWKAMNYKFHIPDNVREASRKYLLKSNAMECMENYLFRSGEIYEKCSCVDRCRHEISWDEMCSHIKDRKNVLYENLTRSQKEEVGFADSFLKYLEDKGVRNFEFEHNEGEPYSKYKLKRFQHREVGFFRGNTDDDDAVLPL